MSSLSSKKQETVAQSSREAEFFWVSLATRHIIWLRRTFEDLSEIQEKGIELLCGNKSTIAIMKNPSILHGSIILLERQLKPEKFNDNFASRKNNRRKILLKLHQKKVLTIKTHDGCSTIHIKEENVN